MKPTVCVLLPALNEQNDIGKVIRGVPLKFLNEIYDVKIIVADGGSTDMTVITARDNGAYVHKCKQKGKGNQVREVLGIHNNFDFYVMLDSDNTYPAGLIPKFLDALWTYDVAMGVRYPVEKGALHKWGNMVFCLIGNVLFLSRYRDLCTGMWTWRGKTLRSFDLTATGFDLEANLFAQMIKKKCSVKEIDIPLLCRHGSESKINIWHSFPVIWMLIKERFTK